MANNLTTPAAPAKVSSGPTQGPSFAWPSDVPTLLYSNPAKGGNGQYCLNADKSLVTWRWVPMTFQSGFPVTFSPNEQTDLDVQIGGGSGQRGDTEVGALLLTSTGRVAVQPYVTSPIDKYLSNAVIPSSLMFGTSQLPGLLASAMYTLAKTSWRMTVRELSGMSNTVSGALWGRRYSDKGREKWGNDRRRAELLQTAWPFWIGPVGDPTHTGPEVTLAPGATITLRYPVPSFADYLLRWFLDDSTSTTGFEPGLLAKITQEDTARDYVDLPAAGAGVVGISWREFLACPTVTVAGFPSGGFIRAFSLGSPRGGWTQLVKRTSAINITFTSIDAGTITLRTALAGWLLNAHEPADRHYANTKAANEQRHAQAAAAGSNPVRLFGQGGA